MIAEIRIGGLGVIDEAVLEPSPGLTVLSGETGAGKTMVVTSLHLLAGGRADAGRVRKGADRAVVEARFAVADLPGSVAADVAGVIESAGAVTDEDGALIAVRTVNTDGRSRAHLGGRGVPAAVLARLAEPLLTIHGQNDQLRLLRADHQRRALDEVDPAATRPLLDRWRDLRARWREARAELEERTTRSRELAQEADRLRFGITEIEEVDPHPGEDVSLVAEIRRLSDVDALRESATRAHVALLGPGALDGLGDMGTEDTPGVVDLLGNARDVLGAVGDPELRALVGRIDEALALVGDCGEDLGGYLSALPADPDLLEGKLTRQAALKTLTRKYAADVDGVLAWVDEARERLGRIDTSGEAITALRDRVDDLGRELAATGLELSALRTRLAGELAGAVSTELSGLAMGKAVLEVRVDPREAAADDPSGLRVGDRVLHAGTDGLDDVEFLLATHPGAKALPIGRSASGGELSRVMLALEVVLAGEEGGTTLVFDEVDAGVGGRAAIEIGRRLARLARTHQVIVVTHLAQVAAFADTHLVIDKQHDGDEIVSGVIDVEGEARVVELARMLAGMEDTDTGRAHAEELLESARAHREGIGAPPR